MTFSMASPYAGIWLAAFRSSPGYSACRLQKPDAELLRSVATHHAGDNVVRHVGLREHGNRIVGRCRVVLRITRAPDHLLGEIVRHLLDEPLLRVEAKHHLALFPHLLGVC